jgi:hypothetical protein
VKVDHERAIVTYSIISKQEIGIIIALFTKYNLNSSKHLNFLAFKQAFTLYNEPNRDLKELKPIILGIISKMNSKRTDYTMPINHYRITKNWLIGFVEGDGSFSYNTLTRNVIFSIAQKGNEDLLKEIARFLQKSSRINVPEDWVKVYLGYPGQFNLSVNNNYFIEAVLIPLFDSVKWYSKKYLDYKDFKSILKMIQKGFHYLPEGQALIERIVSQINNGRLSTSKRTKLDRNLLMVDIEEFLKQPSNYEIREGRTFILSLNRYRVDNSAIGVLLVEKDGEVLKSFPSVAECAKYLGIARSTVKRRVENGQQFILKPIKEKDMSSSLTREGKLVTIKIVES